VSDSDDAPDRGGFSGALGRLGASMLALLRTRIELATVEFEEGLERTKEMLVLVLCGVLLAQFALLFASLFVVAYFWDTNRLAAIAGVALFYVALALFAFARLRQRARDKPASFAASLSELEQDAAALRRKP
jgi:uncharacterized membrane protein YqjE